MDTLQDKRQSGWFWDSNDVFELNLSVHALVVRLFLARTANGKGEAFPSAKTIGERCGISRRKVFDALTELEEVGLIERHARVQQGKEPGRSSAASNLYVLLTPQGATKDKPGGSAPHALGVVHHMHTKDYPLEGQTNEGRQTDTPTPARETTAGDENTTARLHPSVNNPFSLVTAAYHAHIGMMGPTQSERLGFWYDEGLPAEVMVEAVLEYKERRLTDPSAGFNYLEGIFRNWHNGGVKTVEEARERRQPRVKNSRGDPQEVSDKIAAVARMMQKEGSD